MYLPHKLTSFQDLVLPTTVYKYRRWENDNHKRMLSHAEIYFSKPMDMDGGSELNKRVAEMKMGDWHAYYKSVVKMHFPDATENQLNINATEMLRTMMDDDIKKAPQLVDEIIQELNDEWGALPLGTTPKNRHLWDFFAQSGQGFSVGFFPKKIVTGPLFWGGHVTYYPDGEPPFFRFPSVDKHTYSTDTINVFTSLPSNVGNEEEYRIYKFGAGALNVEKAAISEVIIGYAMPPSNAQELEQIVKANLPDAKLLKSERNSVTGEITVTDY